MNELIAGIIIGGSITFFAFLGSYFFVNWVKEKKQQISDLRREHSVLLRDIDLWYEFNDWKRMKKGKE
jgi:hypothetical protein